MYFEWRNSHQVLDFCVTLWLLPTCGTLWGSQCGTTNSWLLDGYKSMNVNLKSTSLIYVMTENQWYDDVIPVVEARYSCCGPIYWFEASLPTTEGDQNASEGSFGFNTTPTLMDGTMIRGDSMIRKYDGNLHISWPNLKRDHIGACFYWSEIWFQTQ